MPHTVCQSSETSIQQKSLAWSAGAQARFDAASLYAGRSEPGLAEMMSDPIFFRLLASDGLTREQVAKVVETYRKRRNAP